jgi:hypothetical protein
MNLSFGRFVEMPADLSRWVEISDKEILFNSEMETGDWRRSLK